MFAISQALDGQLILFLGSVIGLIGVVNAYILSRIKRETSQVNNAVNHVEPGKKTLTERVDRIEENLHVVQYDLDAVKKSMFEIMDSISKQKGLSEGLLKTHVESRAEVVQLSSKLDDLMKAIPKRKDDDG